MLKARSTAMHNGRHNYYVLHIKLENFETAMHCNLRSPTWAAERRVGSKIEVIFRTFPLLWEGWARSAE